MESTDPKSPVKQTLQTIEDHTPDKYQWRGNKKQKLAMSYWITPGSETFGNAYRSFKLAGFSESYSKNIVGQAPKWISEYLDRLDMTDEHIKQGIQNIATNEDVNSRSPADTNLKAFELLADIKGMTGNKQSTNVTLVQPILSGRSVHTEYQHQPNESNNTNKEAIDNLETDTENSTEIDRNDAEIERTHSPTSYIEGELVD